MDHEDVAEALATAARTVTYTPRPGAAAAALTAHGFALESLGTLPSFEVGEFDIAYDKTFGTSAQRLSEVLVTCRVYTSRADDRSGHALLKQLLGARGAGSVKAALEADRTLGGLVEALQVERVRGYGVYEVSGTNYYGARFDVRIWGRG